MLINTVESLYLLAIAGTHTIADCGLDKDTYWVYHPFRKALHTLEKGCDLFRNQYTKAYFDGEATSDTVLDEARSLVIGAIEQIGKMDTTGFPVDTLAIIAAIGAVMVTHEKEFIEC